MGEQVTGEQVGRSGPLSRCTGDQEASRIGAVHSNAGGARKPSAGASREPSGERVPAVLCTTPRPDIQVIVTFETLLGLAQDPAEIPGLGPIPADVARALAADGRWHAWITDAAGAVTATGTSGYVPTAALSRLVRARESRCRFVGCMQPATRCDLDHAMPWPGGPTAPGNVGPLCRRHHVLKTQTAWDLKVSEPEGGSAAVAWTWTSPAGLVVHDQPEPPLSFG